MITPHALHGTPFTRTRLGYYSTTFVITSKRDSLPAILSYKLPDRIYRAIFPSNFRANDRDNVIVSSKTSKTASSGFCKIVCEIGRISQEVCTHLDSYRYRDLIFSEIKFFSTKVSIIDT